MRSPRTTTKSSPRSPHLEKAHVQQQRPNATINKLINFKKELGKEYKQEIPKSKKKKRKATPVSLCGQIQMQM